MECVAFFDGFIAFKARRFANHPMRTVIFVTGDGITDIGQVDPNLVIAPRKQDAFDERMPGESLNDPHLRFCGTGVFCVGSSRH